MPTLKCEGVVLDSVRVSEADRLVTFFTPDHGKVVAKARGIAKTTSKYGAAAELFAHDLFGLYSKTEAPDVYTLTECSVLDSRSEIRTDLARLGVAAFLAETVLDLTPHHDPVPELWELLQEAADVLTASAEVAAVPWIFFLKLLEILGHLPDLTTCQSCGKAYNKGSARFAPEEGGIVCQRCRPTEPGALMLHGSTVRWIGALLHTGLLEANGLPREKRNVTELERMLLAHGEYQLEWRPGSLEFLKGAVG